MKAGRFEYKYLLPVNKIAAMRDAIQPYVTIDPFMEKGDGMQYTVRSIYYDTHDLETYREKIEGIRDRKKFRIRGYNRRTEESMLFLEIKRKRNAIVTKDRAPLYVSDSQMFFSAADPLQYIQSLGMNGTGRHSAEKFLYYYYSKMLEPIALIAYEREAYVGIVDTSLRITIDKDVRSHLSPILTRLHSEDSLVPALEGYAILELKFSQGVPAWLRTVLASVNLKRQALSKYIISIDSHGEGTAEMLSNSSRNIRGNTIMKAMHRRIQA